MIRRNITYKEKGLIIPLYKAIVRPPLEYCIIIIIKCMYSRCRRDEIHVCFAYASPQCMPHM